MKTIFAMFLASVSVVSVQAGTVELTCSSTGVNQSVCELPPGVKAVNLKEQLSTSDCLKGHGWDYTCNKLWVDHGCRAVFTVKTALTSGCNTSMVQHCSSWAYNENTCYLKGAIAESVSVQEQLSSSACAEGQSWKLSEDKKSIHVSSGCKANFLVNF